MRVPGHGPPNAKIVFCGEAPGADEDQIGLPFMGSSGRLLNQILEIVGIKRNECYLTNVVKHRPLNNRFEALYEDTQKTTPSPSLRLAVSELHDELRALRPNVIVPLGGEALRALTGQRSIDKWRGSIQSSAFGKLIATYHPAYILRVYDDLPIFTQDLRRIKEDSLTPDLNLPLSQFEISPTFGRVYIFLSDLLSNPRRIAFDIETTGRGENSHVRCLGIADSPLHAICIPFASQGTVNTNSTSLFPGPSGNAVINNHWSIEEEREILRLLKAVFADPRIEKIAQNFPFDSTILAEDFGIIINNLLIDTLVASHNLHIEFRKSLDFLASLYTRIPYYSDYEASSDLSTWTYNCWDCIATYQIADKMLVDLKSRSLSPTYTSWDFQRYHLQPAMQVMTKIGTRGCLIDTKVRDELKDTYTSQMIPLEKEFRELAGMPDISLGSTKQLQELFYEKLSLPKQFHPRTKAPTLDENALETLEKRHPKYKRFFDLILEWRERQKLVSTYLDIPLTSDGRVLTSYNSSGTDTGRCSSAATIFGLGTNLQNIPVRSDLGRPLRRMFRAQDGFVILKSDLSQAQFRMVCWFGRINRIIQRYVDNPNFDIHKWVASLIYKVPEESVIKSQRDIAKNGVYGGSFGMMPQKAAKTYKLPLTEATFVLNEYRRAIPEIPQWWLDVQREINTTRILTNPFGRQRMFFGRLDDNLYRKAYAYLPQSTEADLIHRACIALEQLLPGYLCMQVHDEVVLHVPEVEAPRVARIVKNVLQYPIKFPGVDQPLIIPADVSWGPNWLDQTKWKE